MTPLSSFFQGLMSPSPLPPRSSPIGIPSTSQRLSPSVELALSPKAPQINLHTKKFSPLRVDTDHLRDCPLLALQGVDPHTIRGLPAFQQLPPHTSYPPVIQQLIEAISIETDPLKQLLRALFPKAKLPLCNASQVAAIAHSFSYTLTQMTLSLEERYQALETALDELGLDWKKRAIQKGVLQPIITLVRNKEAYLVGYVLESFLRLAYKEASLFFLVDRGDQTIDYHYLNLRELYKLYPPAGPYQHLLHAHNSKLVASVIANQVQAAYPRVAEIVCHELPLPDVLRALEEMHGLVKTEHAALLCLEPKANLLQLLREILEQLENQGTLQDLPDFVALAADVRKIVVLDLAHFTAPQYASGDLTGYHLLHATDPGFSVEHNMRRISAISTAYPRLRSASGAFQAVYSAYVDSDCMRKRNSKPSSFYPFETTQLCRCLNHCLASPLLRTQPVDGRCDLFGRFNLAGAAVYTQIMLRQDPQTNLQRIMTAYPLVLVEDPQHNVDLHQLSLKPNESAEEVPLFQAAHSVSLLTGFLQMARSQLDDIRATIQAELQKKPLARSNPVVQRRNYRRMVLKILENKLPLFAQQQKFNCYEDSHSSQIVLQASLKKVCGVKLSDHIRTCMQLKFNAKTPDWVNLFEDLYYGMDQVSLFTSWEMLAAHFYDQYEEELLALLGL